MEPGTPTASDTDFPPTLCGAVLFRILLVTAAAVTIAVFVALQTCARDQMLQDTDSGKLYSPDAVVLGARTDGTEAWPSLGATVGSEHFARVAPDGDVRRVLVVEHMSWGRFTLELALVLVSLLGFLVSLWDACTR